MKLPIIKTGRPWTVSLFAVTVVSLFFMWIWFASQINILGSQRLVVEMAKYMADIVLIVAPYWLLRPRWRVAVTVAPPVAMAFILINVWYYRFWGSILPVKALSMTGNVNVELAGCLPGLWSWSDLVVIIVSFLPLVSWIFIRRRVTVEPGLCLKHGLVLTLSGIIFYVIVQLGASELKRRWQFRAWGLERNIAEVMVDRLFKSGNSATDLYKDSGMVCFVGQILYSKLSEAPALIELTDDEVRRVNNYIDERKSRFPEIDSTFVANRGKNIVFVVVESLNADVIGRRVGGYQVTPVLDSLISAQGTISALGMKTQITLGASGDGQLIYNTGLLPLNDEITPVSIIPVTTLYPLARNLGVSDALAVFGDNGSWWNKNTNFGQYGFSKSYPCSYFDEECKRIGADRAMFDYGLQLIDTMKRPFFLEFITFSMHVPFNDPGVPLPPWGENPDGMPSLEAAYLRMTNYFDAALGDFIKALKHMGIWNDTVLFIASDHNQDVDGGVGHGKEKPIVFIAAGTGKSVRIKDRQVGQIDVYPTVLDIMGRGKSDIFNGVGVSMLSCDTTDVDCASEISRLILKGDWFRRVLKEK